MSEQATSADAAGGREPASGAELLREDLSAELDAMAAAGTLKTIQVLESPQGPEVELRGRGRAVVLSSNDYLGLAAHPEVIAAGHAALDRYGAGTASVRFICGLFAPHLELEADLADFLGTEAALTYTSCWNANHAVLDALCDAQTEVFSDALNHASIIDAIRLARPAAKSIYPHSDLDALAGALAASTMRRKLVVTDGVFSMEGDLARLPELIDLCREHGAVLIVDDSHGLGVLGERGAGTGEHFGLADEVDITTGTLGKALGGAAGGFVAGDSALCRVLEQRSRPQLFSNGLAPAVAAGSRRALGLLAEDPGLVGRLRENVATFRGLLGARDLEPLPGDSAIVPLIVGETSVAIDASRRLLDDGVFVTGFGFPVVPEGTARIRAQISAAHTERQLMRAADALSAALARGDLGAPGSPQPQPFSQGPVMAKVRPGYWMWTKSHLPSGE
ncbi:MAG TPA: aminotransferase class I/II-fold pyridoxal phosphate-dependent enzyme [Solirubrobacterales bacterium]|nr:aminotransferase class I/II-fold pyridoxal phosphate-dependent enzyme [Solirubrobacterales bacterium]